MDGSVIIPMGCGAIATFIIVGIAMSIYQGRKDKSNEKE